jgi:uncharacterized protein (TIGR02246 family)
MIRISLLLLITALLVGPCIAAASAQSPASGADEEAIKAPMIQTTDAFNKHDAKAWAQFCTSDAQLVTVRGESMKGIAEIEQGLAAIFETRGRRATLKTLDIAVRVIRPDVALVHLTNEMSGVTSADGQPLPAHRELSIRVVVKERGVWRITAFHNTIVQPSSR